MSKYDVHKAVSDLGWILQTPPRLKAPISVST